MSTAAQEVLPRSDDVWWTAKEARAYLGLRSPTTFFALADEPDFPERIRIGKACVRWLKSEIVAYAESRRERRAS